ncbi:hypothetical protein FGE12_19145 [Aggregicoccus sp. 17bor-14]|uniref:hypothetical protein n=1 Tax=Myxococcaceae TaxID=31 RepID=UPI00129C75EC|nr:MULTISPECIES: hypothetical protein [Myxococcaceae]MBF5044523.1 hypothetical protein [Simulacricoccus sp. 17bor-14]MRI90268.1 hypothetical protein [Aggregicoccus sp. 17bor-14]
MKPALVPLSTAVALLFSLSAPAAEPVPDGFQAAKFGMTRAEVLKAIPGAEEGGNGSLSVEKKIVGIAADVSFLFERNGRFQTASIEFETRGGGFVEFRRVRDALTRKYGEPTEKYEDVFHAIYTWGTHDKNYIYLEWARADTGNKLALLYRGDLRLINPEVAKAEENDL